MNELIPYIIAAVFGAFIATLVKSQDRTNGRIEGYYAGAKGGQQFERDITIGWINAHPEITDVREIVKALQAGRHVGL
jgi:hypothetical protein